MGAWGTGILQNDTTADILAEFKEYYNKGLSVKEIRIKLVKEYRPGTDPEYYSEIWTGIAYGQWMYGEIEDYIFKKVKASTQVKWLTLFADDKKLLQQRIKSLSEFIVKIQTPRPKSLKRKKIIVRHSYFRKGDVIGIRINAKYCIAAIVTSHFDSENDGENEIIFTDLFFKDQTTIKDVLKANIYYFDIGGATKYYRGFCKAIFSARNMSRQIDKAFLIGKIDPVKFPGLGVGTPIGDWKKVEVLVEEQLEFLKKYKTDKPINVSVKQFLKRDDKLENTLIEWDKKIFREKLKSQNSL